MLRLKALIPLSEAQWYKLDLLKDLVQRDLAARYKGSVLGSGWALIKQLAQLLIYTYLFSVVLKVDPSDRGVPTGNANVTYSLWLFAGLLPWLTFSSSLSSAARVVLQQRNLVTKVIFPLELLPLIPVLSAFLESTFGLVVLILFTTTLSQTLHITLLLLPLAWLPQLLLTVGLAYLTAALTVFLRDIPEMVDIFLRVWFYATPILYPLDLVPDPIRTLITWLNPLTAVVATYREVILLGEISSWQMWSVAVGLSAIVCGLGYWVYQHLRSTFADIL